MPFVRNVLKFQITTVITMIVGLITSVLYARLLGAADYGFLAVIGAFAGILSITAGWGQETTTTTFLAEAIGRKDERDAHVVLRYFVQSTTIAIVIFAVLIFFSPWIAEHFYANALAGQYARLILLNTALQPFPTLLLIMLQITGRIGLVSFIENIRTIVQLTLVTVLLFLGYGIVGILAGTLVVSILFVPICIILYEHFRGDLHFPSLIHLMRTVAHGGTGTYFRQGLWIALDRQVARNIYPNLFLLVLGATTSLASVGLFRLALRLATLPAELVLPAITRLSAISIPRIVGQDRGALRKSVFKLLKGTVALAILAITGAIVFIPLLLPYVYGEEFTGAIPIFFIIIPFNIISACNIASVPLARVFKKVWAMMLINITGVAIAIGGYIFFLRHVLPPAHAMGWAILYYHVHSLLLYVFIWWRMRRPGRDGC